jgi:hypothetical protein
MLWTLGESLRCLGILLAAFLPRGGEIRGGIGTRARLADLAGRPRHGRPGQKSRDCSRAWIQKIGATRRRRPPP